MTTQKQFSIGSITSGTLKTEDLLQAFADALKNFDPDNSFLAEAYTLLEVGDRWNGHDEPTIDWNDDQRYAAETLVNESLFEALMYQCPPFVYFGALEGDGADFGFWPDREELTEAIDPTNGLSYVNANGEYVLEEGGMIVNVNDHGNLAVYDMDRNLLWDCV